MRKKLRVEKKKNRKVRKSRKELVTTPHLLHVKLTCKECHTSLSIHINENNKHLYIAEYKKNHVCIICKAKRKMRGLK